MIELRWYRPLKKVIYSGDFDPNGPGVLQWRQVADALGGIVTEWQTVPTVLEGEAT